MYQSAEPGSLLKVADFGLAMQVEDAFTETVVHSVIGSAGIWSIHISMICMNVVPNPTSYIIPLHHTTDMNVVPNPTSVLIYIFH